MAYSIAVWENTPDTWSFDEQDLTSFIVKFLIKSSNKIQNLSESGVWTDVEIVGEPQATDFESHGIEDLSVITEEQWAKLPKPIEIYTWTDKEDATGASVGYNQKEFGAPELELTVPEYSLLDDLERPISVITCTDGDKIPVLKSEYDLQNVGTRIMKRG